MKKNNIKKALLAIFAILFVLIATSCEAADMGMTESMDIAFDGANGNSYSGGLMRDEMYVEVEEEAKAEAPEGLEYAERKIIYNSWYDISTEEYEKSVAALDALCEKYGAYYERAETYGEKTEYTSRRAEYTVRIPQKNYKAFTDETGNIGTVTHSGESNKDVTEQYFDTEARLESAQLREERLLEILENAKTLDDVLTLERELSDVRYEIESYSGTLRKYDSLVSYSTATVTIREVKKVTTPVTEKMGLSEKLSAALDSGFDAFYEAVTAVLTVLAFCLPGFLFVVLPIAVIILIIVLVAVRKHKKKNK